MAGKRKAEARRWCRQAIADLEAARWNTKGCFHDTASFLAQQAAEKALKSLLYYQGARRTALLTHSIVEMVQEAAKHEDEFRSILPEARELDLHYIPSRYPNGLPSGYPHEFYSPEVAERAIGFAERILGAVRQYYLARGENDLVSDDGS